MKVRMIILCAWLCYRACGVAADDVDALVSGDAAGRTFVHIVMDTGDTAVNPVLCHYGVDCAPPFMTASAHRHLQDMYSHGDGVTGAGMFKAVLAAVLENPLLNEVRFSLLIPNRQQNADDDQAQDQGGGTILSGYKRLGDSREELVSLLKSIPLLSADLSHSLQLKESYFEWLRYIRGGDVELGDATVGNFGQVNPLPDYDRGIIHTGQYQSPIVAPDECPAAYSILYTQDGTRDDNDLDGQIAAELDIQGEVSFVRMLEKLHGGTADLVPQLDSSVTLGHTWVVTSRSQPGAALDYARAGGGSAALYVDDPVLLQQQLEAALAERVEPGGSLAAPAFSGGSMGKTGGPGQMFLPMYRAQWGLDWPGNVKKLALANGAEGTVQQAVDARGKPAFELSAGKGGRLRSGALTYWTDPGVLPLNHGQPSTGGADGPVVARGGAGQKLDGFVRYRQGEDAPVEYFIGDSNSDQPVAGYPARQIYYLTPDSRALFPFDASSAALDELRPLLDPGSEKTDEDLLRTIRWGRGQDTARGNPSSRSWILGSILHSRPLVLNYGAMSGHSASNPNIRLFFGSGHGLFHILENTDTQGRESGREVFAFYPAQSLSDLGLIQEGDRRAPQMSYGVDGEPVALTRDRNGDGTLDYRDGDEAIVFFGMRRGGSSYFALDVSNPEQLPVVLWQIGPDINDAFPELGLTFSTPVVGRVNYSGKPVDVIIFAGGYNGGWHEQSGSRIGKDLGADDDEVGNAIYIVNARTGELIWKANRGTTGVNSNTHYEHAGLVDSIPSTVSVLRTPAGIIHRLYVGDTGGSVWRVDLPVASSVSDSHRRNNWFITRLADLGADAGEPGGAPGEDRRFFHAAEIVRSFDSMGEFDGVLIQSGNRADPGDTQVENALFYLKDREVISGSHSVRAENEADTPGARFVPDDLLDQTGCISGTEVSAEGDSSGPCGGISAEQGWRVRYLRPGEKGLSAPLVDGGRVFATTFVPGDRAACPRQPGEGQVHAVRLINGTAVANQRRRYKLGSGIPSAPLLTGDVIYFSGDGVDLYDLDGDGVRDKSKFLPSMAQQLFGVYWREPGADPL